MGEEKKEGFILIWKSSCARYVSGNACPIPLLPAKRLPACYCWHVGYGTARRVRINFRGLFKFRGLFMFSPLFATLAILLYF